MILFITRIPPDRNGNGGSQRAYHLLHALSLLGEVHLLVTYRRGDHDAERTDLAEVQDLTSSHDKVELTGFLEPRHRFPYLPWKVSQFLNLASMRTPEAPRLSRRELDRVTARLPTRAFDLVFAGRLPTASVADQLIGSGRITATARIVDFDDIMSRFRGRQLAIDARPGRPLWYWPERADIRRIRQAERRFLKDWDGVCICSEDDKRELDLTEPVADVTVIPNASDRQILPWDQRTTHNVLFVGSLVFEPNVHGISIFAQEIWPLVKRALPDATLNVVGLFPPARLRVLLEAAGATLHANVPSTTPFYAACDVVAAPVFFGGGTRIKIIEAMSYGRPVVSTTIGAEGLAVVAGRDILIADDAAAFADAIVRLCVDADLRRKLASAAKELQRRLYSPAAIDNAVASAVQAASPSARTTA